MLSAFFVTVPPKDASRVALTLGDWKPTSRLVVGGGGTPGSRPAAGAGSSVSRSSAATPMDNEACTERERRDTATTPSSPRGTAAPARYGRPVLARCAFPTPCVAAERAAALSLLPRGGRDGGRGAACASFGPGDAPRRAAPGR